MRTVSQLLVALRLLSTIDKFSARLTIHMDSGSAHLYCLNERILFVELGDSFPVSWLARMMMGEVAGKLQLASTSEEKIDSFRAISEVSDLKNAYADVVKRHLSELFASSLRKCEMRADRFPSTPSIMTLSEMMAQCGSGLVSSFPAREILGSQDPIFKASADYVERTTRVQISLQEGYLLSRLDSPLRLSEILSTVPGNEDSIRSSLLMLWAYGIIDSPHLSQMLPKIDAVQKAGASSGVVVAEKLTDSARAQIEMIEQTYQGLARKDFYSLLDVSNKADVKEIKAAYYKLARKFHPDRFYGMNDPTVKEKVDIIFSTVNVAYETLKNSRTRKEYDSSSLDERQIGSSLITTEVAGTGAKDTSKVAEDYFQRAQKAYSDHNFYEAVQFLRSATQIAPDVPKYWRNLGIALSKNDDWRKEAEDSFQRAVELEPFNHENFLYLAYLYKNSGLKLRAKKCFQSVVELDPKNEIAVAELEEMEWEESTAGKKSLLSGLFKKR